MAAETIDLVLKDDAGSTLHTFSVPKNKLDATAAPGVGDDDADGYVAGSIWADRTNNKIYLCTDNATGAASWTEAGAGGGSTQVKDAVRVATASAGTLASSFENGDTVDGVTLATGDRILIWRQVTATENGIYTVNASGAPTRATDADTASEIWKCSFVVLVGTTHGGTWFFNTNATSPTIGATNLTFRPVGVAATASTVTDEAIVRWDGTAGDQVQNSGVTISDTDDMTIPGNIILSTAGDGLLIKEGSNACMGIATLSSGTVTVSTTKVTANSRIFLTMQSCVSPTAVGISARVAGTSFTILSSSLMSTDTVAWMIVEPAP
jgi:hypothetical protein